MHKHASVSLLTLTVYSPPTTPSSGRQDIFRLTSCCLLAAVLGMLEENNLHVLIVGAHLPNTLGPERVCISKIFQLAMHRIVTNFLFQVNFRHDKRVLHNYAQCIVWSVMLHKCSLQIHAIYWANHKLFATFNIHKTRRCWHDVCSGNWHGLSWDKWAFYCLHSQERERRLWIKKKFSGPLKK